MECGMDCKELQNVLPNLIDDIEKSPAKEHLYSCAVCSQLVQDLIFIRKSARLLLPLADPHPRVWKMIEGSLFSEKGTKLSPSEP
jgi:hypothetical protein